MTLYEDLLQPIRQFLAVPTPQAWIEQAAQPEQQTVLLIDHLHCELKAAQSAALLLRRYVLDEEQGEQVLSWLLPYEDAIYRQGPLPSQKSNQAVPRLSVDAGTEADAPWKAHMVDRMVLLMKEELHHFMQVFQILQSKGIAIQPVSASRYAAGLMQHVRTYEPQTLVDKLIIGALIEARSCERFAALAPHLEPELAQFYISLLRSEARHFEDYLSLAAWVKQTEPVVLKNQVGSNQTDVSDALEQMQSWFQEKKQDLSLDGIQEDMQRLIAAEAELITTTDSQFRFHSGVPVL